MLLILMRQSQPALAKKPGFFRKTGFLVIVSYTLLAACGCLWKLQSEPIWRPSKTSGDPGTTAQKRLPRLLTLELGKKQTLELLLVPTGQFLMGSPKNEPGRDEDEPLYRARISRPFYLGKYEVTQGQWEAVMGENPSFFQDDPRLPAETVTWEMCVAFCRKLAERTGRKVHLPTEAQWEYACRAGSTTPFAFGIDITPMDANYDWSEGGALNVETLQKSALVGSFPANPWGFFDMHGNVREWCADWYGRYVAPGPPVIDPKGPESGTVHVMRGGCWDDYSRRCRSAYRHGYRAGDREECNGFRVYVEAVVAENRRPGRLATAAE